MEQRVGMFDELRVGRVCLDTVGAGRWRGILQLMASAGLVLACTMVLVGVARAAAESCPNTTTRQGPSAGLPECRAYEQVTPVDKGDAIDLFPIEALPGTQGTGIAPIDNDAGYAAEDGDEFLLNADSSIGGNAPTGRASYVFSRGAKGWNPIAVDPPIARPQVVTADVFDPTDLSVIGFHDEIGPQYADLLAGNDSNQWSNLVGPPAGPYATLASVSGVAASSEGSRFELVGASEDLSHVVLESQNHSLVPVAEGQDPRSRTLYEAVGGRLSVVNLNNEGKLLNPCGANLGQGQSGTAGDGGAHSAVSSDGSKVFFTAPDPTGGGEKPIGPGCWNGKTIPSENPPEVYVRVNGETTIEISNPEEGVEVGTSENPALPAVFVGASKNGSRAFFVTATELTNADKGHALELYEYNTEPGVGEKALTLISGGESGAAEGNVDFVAAVSSDGSTVYFAAYGALAPGASELTEGHEPTDPVNLYRYDTVTGVTTFITTVNEGDFPEKLRGEHGIWYGGLFGLGKAEFLGLSSEAGWYTTADGGYLVFETTRPITGYNNAEAPGSVCASGFPGGVETGTCVELYRYDAATSAIVCVSCAGGAPVDDAVFTRTPLDTPAGGPPRPISEDGEDVFFDTASALALQAAPGKVHVYEWHDGAISMISSASDPSDAFFLGSSADGSNVFFSTHAQLVPQDTDVSDDIYDARVDGGFPELAAPQCTGTSCQGVPAAPPIFATPASVTFEGVGNFATLPPVKTVVKKKAKPKTCGRGFVNVHGRCTRGRTKRSAKGRK